MPPSSPDGTRNIARIPLILVVTVFVFFQPPRARAEEAPALPSLDDLPVAERFISPVGDPQDFTQPAPGENRGYSLVRGVREKSKRRHLGLDLANSASGGEVRAPADGVVLESGRRGAWGNLVVIAHRVPGGGTVISLLAHLKPGSIAVSKGDRVQAGQRVGSVGRTGRATGPHLHFELRDLGRVNPWLTVWQNAAVLDPLRILGQRIVDALVPGANDSHWAHDLVQQASGQGESAVGNPDELLTRREFYAWAARATGAEVSARSSWSRIRKSLEKAGLVALPKGPSEVRKHVSRREADAAIARLASLHRFQPIADEDAVHVEDPSHPGGHGALPTSTEESAASAKTPERKLTRAEGALLLLSARSSTAVAAAQ